MKQVTIEIPDNKRVVWKNNRIELEDIDSWESITTFKQAFDVIHDLANNGCNEAKAILEEYFATLPESYSRTVTMWRIVVFALTNNEKKYLTHGERWFSTIEFCIPGNIENCFGDKVLGHIKFEEKIFEVVGGAASHGANSGLGDFDSDTAVSFAWTYAGFRSVSSQEIAKHLSTCFGRLLFEVQYGGVNCDWKWID